MHLGSTAKPGVWPTPDLISHRACDRTHACMKPKAGGFSEGFRSAHPAVNQSAARHVRRPRQSMGSVRPTRVSPKTLRAGEVHGGEGRQPQQRFNRRRRRIRSRARSTGSQAEEPTQLGEQSRLRSMRVCCALVAAVSSTGPPSNASSNASAIAVRLARGLRAKT